MVKSVMSKGLRGVSWPLSILKMYNVTLILGMGLGRDV